MFYDHYNIVEQIKIIYSPRPAEDLRNATTDHIA